MRYLEAIFEDTGIRLSKNEDFYQWIVDQGPTSKLPRYEEDLWSYINNRNIKNNLYGLYNWTDPRHTRHGFLTFLKELVDWYSRYTGSTDVISRMRFNNPEKL